ncbi:bifunctional riboflavin kinase/FAD synthetase [Blautia sp. MSJ-19]|uniref:bifunctional riboflavin kinase/FAD synthetase n=1 Tax=Blautia sp. MSJ-19 TaxID=2841517 RepID=UPI001C0E98F2|nr:bifunctional riboflavin kinase/FAD synthetase [Blautia sp. MSJ-19]MBU5482423.1 bifunctional riboflavin kinase/FAD synthetase [Blautia sp. MSJ-19]
MEYVRIDGQFPKFTRSAVTLGKFDGIHRGHRKLIQTILDRKKEYGELAVVMAFVSDRQTILTSAERRMLLEKMGVDVLLECPLNEQVRHMKADGFIRQILKGDLQASCVVVGEDFRFGYERKGTPELLERYGEKYTYDTVVISKEMEGNRKVSSTYIREELKKGNMEKITELLGNPFFTAGTIEHGRGMGHRDFFPTTNIIPPKSKLMPPNGVYVTVSHFADGDYPGITNVGYKPTVGESFLGVETNLFDCDRDLYGEKCVVDFYKFIRPEQKFASFEALKAQIRRDIETGKDYFLSGSK